MYQLNKSIWKMQHDHIETLTTKIVRDLAASGVIRIEDLSNRLYKGKTKTPEILSVSKIIEKLKNLGLVPVLHPDLGTTDRKDDNNSARNKRRISGGDTGNTKQSQLMDRLKSIHNKIKKLSTAAAEERIVDTQRVEDIGGEKVIVNILPDGIVEGMKDIDIGTSDIYTPVNYYETYEYFETVNENRKAYLRAIQRIGDMLVAGELEGDKEAWQKHTTKADDEYRAWKQKCNKSNAIFKKTGRIMGYNDTKAPKWIHSFCPCQ